MRPQRHRFPSIIIIVVVCCSVFSCKTMDSRLGDLAGQLPGIGDGLTRQDFYQGVMDALSIGVQRAVESLGKSGGYYGDIEVRIPVSEQLQEAAATLRRLGKGKYVDRFVKTMNNAAEQAVPQAKTIFIDAVKQMRIDDAKRIVDGPDNAATQYFRDKTYDALEQAFLPVVRNATNQVNLTASYKQMTDKVGFLGKYLAADTLDLDAYITRKALDGLFVKLAEEEKKIRHDPVARTTEILKKVFG